MMRYILAALVSGALAGFLINRAGVTVLNTLFSSYLFDLSLIALLFIMGVVFGADEDAVKRLRMTGIKILIYPASIALGSVLGGLLGGLLLKMNIYAAMGVCAGFGWYTLAGPLVGQLFGVEWGAVGFVVNFMRELITIVAAPAAARIDKYAPVAMGGATAMDTTMPVIIRYSGQEALITAFTSGFMLTLLAPFAITAIAALA